MTALSRGPASSTSAMRSRYACVSARDVSDPEARRSLACVALNSTTDSAAVGAASGARVWELGAHSHVNIPAIKRKGTFRMSYTYTSYVATSMETRI